MTNAIHIARQHPQVSKDKKTLKLFMAPEFYFRGGEGAYNEDHISEIFREMRGHTKDKKKYGNWLFVLGTAVAAHDAWWDPDAAAAAPVPGAAKEIWNVCLIQKGGFKRDDAGILRCCQLCGAPSPFTSSVVVYKEYVSNIDFIAEAHDGAAGISEGNVHSGRHKLAPVAGGTSTPGRVREIDPGIAATAPERRHPRGAGAEMSKTGLGGQSVFMIDGITFGIEVCLDHLTGRLRQSPPSAGQPIVQVQLIPSAGMSIENANVVCMRNGYVFNVDGHTPVGPPRGHTLLKKRTGAGLNPAHFQTIPPDDNIRVKLKGSSKVTVTHSKYFSDYGQMFIFPRQQLPNPRKA